MRFNYLQKIVISATLISLAIFLDIFCELLLPFKMPFGGSVFKISCLPLFLIGFLFGVKYSFMSCLLFASYHLYKAGFFSLEIIVSILNKGLLAKLEMFLFDYILPDLAFSISGIFYVSDFKHFANRKIIISSLLLIYLLIIISRVTSFYLVWYDVAIDMTQMPFFLKYLWQSDYILLYAIIYNFISVIFSFLLNTIILCLLNAKIKIQLHNHCK